MKGPDDIAAGPIRPTDLVSEMAMNHRARVRGESCTELNRFLAANENHNFPTRLLIYRLLQMADCLDENGITEDGALLLAEAHPWQPTNEQEATELWMLVNAPPPTTAIYGRWVKALNRLLRRRFEAAMKEIDENYDPNDAGDIW